MSNWKGYEEDKWSGKKSDKRWFPFSIDRHDVEKIKDLVNEEETLVFFEFNDQSGKVNRIGNINKVNERKVVVKVKNEQVLAPNWTRVYTISSDKDGEDFSTIDFPITVPTFYLIKDKGKWKADSKTTITISNTPI